jgi:HEPN domain-containing protein
MKKRVSNLLDLAEQDAEVAEHCVDFSPNLAAFHAQQCAEKSLKAFCLELSDTGDCQEQALLKKIGHDSIRAVMKALPQILTKLFERSGYADYAARFSTPKAQDEKRAAALYQMFRAIVDSVVRQITDLSASTPGNAWINSFDKNLEPRVRLNLSEEKELGLANTEEIVNMAGQAFGLPSLTKADPLSLVTQLNDLAKQSESVGNASLADAFRKASKGVNRLAPLCPWARLCEWAPYLDAHAVTGRYPSPDQLEAYKSRTIGVKNLVGKAKQIMIQSKHALTVLTD